MPASSPILCNTPLHPLPGISVFQVCCISLCIPSLFVWWTPQTHGPPATASVTCCSLCLRASPPPSLPSYYQLPFPSEPVCSQAILAVHHHSPCNILGSSLYIHWHDMTVCFQHWSKVFRKLSHITFGSPLNPQALGPRLVFLDGWMNEWKIYSALDIDHKRPMTRWELDIYTTS